MVPNLDADWVEGLRSAFIRFVKVKLRRYRAFKPPSPSRTIRSMASAATRGIDPASSFRPWARTQGQIELQLSPPSAEVLRPDGDGDAVERIERIAADVDKITLSSRSTEIRFLESSDRPSEGITIPWSPQTFRRKRAVILPPSELASGARPIRAEARRKLLSAIAKGRRWLDEIASRKVVGVEAIAARESVSERSARMGLSSLRTSSRRLSTEPSRAASGFRV